MARLGAGFDLDLAMAPASPMPVGPGSPPFGVDGCLIGTRFDQLALCPALDFLITVVVVGAE